MAEQMTRAMTAEERFWHYVTPEPNTGCWLWAGPYAGDYGLLSAGNGKRIKSHRFSYVLHKGKIPDGLVIDHLCNQTWCVNPDHLAAVTNWQNVERTNCFSAVNARKSECKRGHSLTGGNLMTYPDGRRWCRACERLSDLRKIERRRARPKKSLKREACKAGHPFVEGNIYFSKNGGRHCRACAMERAAMRREEMRRAG